jgi:two-component system response regulator YesN
MFALLRKYVYGMKRSSVLVKFTLYFVTLLSMIILLSYVIYFVSISKYFMDEITTNNEQILKQAVSTYEVFLDSTIKAAMVNMEEDITRSVFFNEDGFFNNEIIYNKLNSILKTSNFIYSIYYFEQNPEIIYTSAGLSFDIRDFYDQEWLESLEFERNFYLLPARKLLPLSGNEKDVIPVVINLPYNSANPLYTYVLNLDANALFNYMIKNTNMKKERNFKIIDQNGMIIISYNEPNDIFRNIQELYPYAGNESLLYENEGSFLYNENREKFLISFFQSPKYGWKYICEINLNLVTQNMYRPITIILYISLLLLLLSIAVSISLSRKLYKPVRDIVNLIGYSPNHGEEDEYEYIGKRLRRYLEENNHLQKEVNKNKQLMQKLFLSNLVAKNIYTPDEIREKFQYFGLTLYDNYTVLVMEIDDAEYIHNLKPDHKVLFEYAIEDISMETAKQYGTSFFISMETCKYVLVFSKKSEKDIPDIEKFVAGIAGEIQQAIRDNLKLTITIGIGSTVHDIGKLNNSYHEASKASGYKETLGAGEIILFSELDQSDIDTIKYPEELEEKLSKSIISGDFTKSETILKDIFAVLNQQKYIHKPLLQIFSMHLLNTLMKLIIFELDFSETDVFANGNDFSSMCSILMKVQNEAECKKIFTDIVKRFCDCVNEKRSNAANTKVGEMMDYIEKKYYRPISVDSIADEVGLNRCYAGRLFKQYNNLSMVDYINHVRINKAVELLNQTDMKVFEIAEKVGFNNTHYFIKIFKKLMDMTPGQYKEQLSSKKNYT